MVHAIGEDSFDTIIDAIRKKNAKITSASSREPTLEDVFLQITGHEVRDSANQKIAMPRRGFMGGGAKARVR